MSIENAAMISGAVNYLLIDGQTKCLKTLQESDLVTLELGNVTDQLQDFLGRTALADILLVLGIGGAAAYIWKQTFSQPEPSNNFLHWLFSEQRLRGEAFKPGRSRRERECLELSVGGGEAGGAGDRSLGLNILTGSRQNKTSEQFLKQRLFDVGRRSDTTRFRPDRRKMERGNPDGVEDCEASEDKRAGLMSKHGRCSVSSDMENIMKKAKDVRKLIRESSFDSLASEFLLDIEFDVRSLDNESVTEDITVTSDTEDYVLDSNIFTRFKSNEAWRLVNSTRESSLFSEKEFSFDERQHSFLPGFTTEDLGSTSDAWEWDDEYYLEDDLTVAQPSNHGAWLPEYSKELDLELELDNDVKVLTRLPPSGCSSVESI